MKHPKPVTPPRQRKYLNRVSERRREEQKQYLTLRSKFLREHPLCQRCNTEAATDVHHRAGRTSFRYLCVPLWNALCRECHSWVEHNRLESMKLGWLLHPDSVKESDCE